MNLILALSKPNTHSKSYFHLCVTDRSLLTLSSLSNPREQDQYECRIKVKWLRPPIKLLGQDFKY